MTSNVYASLLSNIAPLRYSLSMRSALNLQTSQQLSISPQLQQAIRLLQLSSTELEQELQIVLEKNLLLEQVDPNLDACGPHADADTEQERGMDYLQGLSCLSDYKKPLPTHNLDSPQKNPELSLQQHVRQQLAMLSLSEKQQGIATALIDALSEDGYLCSTLQAIQKGFSMQVDIHEITAVLEKIQQCEPLGLGARTLSECLKIQLKALPSGTPWLNQALRLVDRHLETLAKRDFAPLMLDLGLDATSLQCVIRLLTSLNPKPGQQIGSQDPGYLIPDLLLHKKNGQRVVALNKDFIPRLRINTEYLTLLKSTKTHNSDLKTFNTHLKEARWFLKSLKTRYETLIKVAHYIVDYQHDFFEHGLEAMKPLSLQAVARAVGLHESTISRITTQKYIHTPQGLLELKYFFSASLPSKEGASRSSTAIRALIRRLIQQEPVQDPLSDQKITRLLVDLNVHVARRTVTKYRESMKIPKSHERKIMGSF
jgi:RNA polymerase sigma-54 factor